MEFVEFKDKMREHIESMLEGQNVLFVTDTESGEMWELYLNSFPEGTNKIFRERREFDCSCCRHFIKSFGNVVTIKDNKKVSIWDFTVKDPKYNTVLGALSKYVKSKAIVNVFITKEAKFGTDKNHERSTDGTVHTWEHFFVELPSRFVLSSSKSAASIAGDLRDVRNVFERSLNEISIDAITTVLELIAQNSLYKGDEWKGVLERFLSIHVEYHNLSNRSWARNNYCWAKSIEVGAVIGKIRNHSIGVLLSDISIDSPYMDIDEAVKRYEKIVAPTNYKRPKAIFTKKMIEAAQETITSLGFLDSLGRRFATIDDITINNILFANKDAKRKIRGDVFDDLQQTVASNPKRFDRVEEVPIETFIGEILPNVSSMQLFVEGRHESNLVSLIAPKKPHSKTMFKWRNGFSWAYRGNITDSMKERVKAMGGNVEGVLRFSIQWNENGKNQNDFDAHSREPDGTHIYYPNKRHVHASSGMLDVDIISPGVDIAVENIIYTDFSKMPKGIYKLSVHVYNYRGDDSGFSAEIEFGGQIYSFEYRTPVKWGEEILIAEVKKDNTGFEIIKSLPSSLQSKSIWGLNTNSFYPVSVCMYSPNYWDDQYGIGHRHYMFMIDGCKNDSLPNGFFNEFLREDLLEHKRVFEALGSKMRVEPSDAQLSGLGFSSTKRNSVICKVEGAFTRTIKLIF